MGIDKPNPAKEICNLSARTLRELTLLEAAARRASSPKAIADLALFKLAARKFDVAVELLEQAHASAPSDAAIASDLASAYLTRARVAEAPYDLVRALAAAEAALALKPKLAEASFNRALALERLMLQTEARSAWQSYLRLDSRSSWSREARAYSRGALPEASSLWDRQRSLLDAAALQYDSAAVLNIVRRFPQQAREYAEGSLLGDWAAAVSGQPSHVDANQPLKILRGIAKSLTPFDPLAEDTVVVIDRAATESNSTWNSLIAGHLKYTRALAESEKGQFESAAIDFARAQSLLAHAGSPFSFRAAFQVAFCFYQVHRYEEERKLLLEIVNDPRTRLYLGLRGRSWWLLGLASAVEGDPAAALTSYSSALALFTALGEEGQIAKLHALLANVSRTLGDDKQLWNHLYRALTADRTAAPPASFYLPLEEAASALRQDLPQIALYFQEEMIHAARLGKNSLVECEALKGRARILRILQRNEEALLDLGQVQELSKKVGDTSLRRGIEGEIMLVRSELSATREPQQAILDLDGSIQIARDGLSLHACITPSQAGNGPDRSRPKTRR